MGSSATRTTAGRALRILNQYEVGSLVLLMMFVTLLRELLENWTTTGASVCDAVLFQLVAGAGFEPTTFGLWARRATMLLHPAPVKYIASKDLKIQIFWHGYLAEAVRFELTKGSHPRQFSRLLHSTTLPRFHNQDQYYNGLAITWQVIFLINLDCKKVKGKPNQVCPCFSEVVKENNRLVFFHQQRAIRTTKAKVIAHGDFNFCVPRDIRTII